MHVVLISACEKRALARTRTVLDGYAVRCGSGTWLTPITDEGLRELQQLLRRSATRNTAVACFRNDGSHRMRLLWVVGRRDAFTRSGASPVGTQKSQRQGYVPPWARTAMLLARYAGLAHDLGKFSEWFQRKLAALAKLRDRVRHEWLSALLLRLAVERGWVAAWQKLPDSENGFSASSAQLFGTPIASAGDAVGYLVATHHRLPFQRGDVINADNHVERSEPDRRGKRGNWIERPRSVANPSVPVLKALTRMRTASAALAAQTPDYWRGVVHWGRLALVLADHSVSSIRRPDHALAYANSARNPKTGKDGLNQDLNWHLPEVGAVASRMVLNLLRLSPPGLSQETIDRICAGSSGRFEWQNRAAQALAQSASATTVPHLVLNVAGTGTGKTRMNLRAACVLAQARGDDTPVRVATALNLRTLTLQTGDAYAHQLDIGDDELACVIGDRLARVLHEQSLAAERPQCNADGDPVEHEFDAISKFDYHDVPDWLAHFLAKAPRMAQVIGAPLLVSTVDFLIAAGELQDKGGTLLPNMRMMTSDIILDEIDGYDTKPLLAVARLVMLAGFYGRNVVASSATLSVPCANIVWKAFRRGVELRSAMTGLPASFVTAFIDDRSTPTVADFGSVESFATGYQKHVMDMLTGLSASRFRVPELQAITKMSEEGWCEAIGAAVTRMHDRHGLTDSVTGKRVSFGLVRIANIRTAILVARHLARTMPDARVVCYHSQHLPLQRAHIERRLDALLTRKVAWDGSLDAHLSADPEIRTLLNASPHENLKFIVVATPVEEIGRDHDFDWGVFEPSTAQALVQGPGRINRHRMHAVDCPNIAILQFNYREVMRTVRGEDFGAGRGNGLVFQKPGLETKSEYAKSFYRSHDLGDLLDWSKLDHLDARLRFDVGSHRFAAADDAALVESTAENLDHFLHGGRSGTLWMAYQTYSSARLREQAGEQVELLLRADMGFSCVVCFQGDPGAKTEFSLPSTSNRVANDWLVLDDKALIAMAGELETLPAQERLAATTVTLPLYHAYESGDLDRIRRHASFGYWIQPKSSK